MTMPDEELYAALVVLARHNITADIQKLLVYGNPDRNVRPGALQAALRATPERLAAKEMLEAHEQMQIAAIAAIAIIPDEASPVREFLEAIHRHTTAIIAKARGQSHERP